MSTADELPAGVLLHIATESDWAAAGAIYAPAGFASEGFVHCSYPAQLLGPANALFVGRNDLVLLVIDPARLTATVKVEDCYDEGQAYPHVYGPIERVAVVRVAPFRPGPDGHFVLPNFLCHQ